MLEFVYLHLSTKTTPSEGWRSLYFTLFHPRMTHLSLDSLILISLFSFDVVYLYLILPAWLNLGETPVLAETPIG